MISLLKIDLQILLSKKDFHTHFPFTNWPENGRSLELHPIWKRRHFSLYNLDLRADGEWGDGAPEVPHLMYCIDNMPEKLSPNPEHKDSELFKEKQI